MKAKIIIISVVAGLFIAHYIDRTECKNVAEYVKCRGYFK